MTLLTVVTESNLFWTKVFYIFFCIAILISYILRDTPFGFLWHLFKWICIGLLITFGIDFVKKSVKDWWKKD